MIIDRFEVACLAVFAAGGAVFAFYIIPRIDLAIAILDYVFRGMP